MSAKPSRGSKLLVWLTGYLWSVPPVVLLPYVAGWQYDADLGWWLAVIYTAPVIFLTEPLGGSVSYFALTAVYFLFLVPLTVLVARRAVGTRSDGS
jgi:predicted dienelactone hydrolase